MRPRAHPIVRLGPLLVVAVTPALAQEVALTLADGGVRYPDGTVQTTAEGAPAPVEDTGQDSCWAVNGQESGCSGTGQDGELQTGVDWPRPRFHDNGDGTVIDRMTGLIWLRWANCYDPVRWSAALSAVSNLSDGGCGLTDGSSAGDWRLPNIRELESLVDYQEHDPPLVSGHPFRSVQTGPGKGYWSSTTHALNPLLAWALLLGFTPDFANGDLTGVDKDQSEYSVWPVRDAVSLDAPAPALVLHDGGLRFPDGSVQISTRVARAPVEASGQLLCYDTDGQVISCAGTGQDAELQSGVEWPSPRFTVPGDGTVLDNLTGLIWLEDADCISPRMWSTALELASGIADGQCGLTDGSEPGDWRLPSLRELSSLIDFGRASPALPADHPFGEVETAFWSSSSVVDLPTEAWALSGSGGGRATLDKGFVEGVWPVRGGH